MKELFNLRHASARNVIERIFGVLKRRFHILLLAPEYDLDIQAQIPTALCAIHNFIRKHDPDEGPLLEARDHRGRDVGHDIPATEEVEQQGTTMGTKRDQIAQAMWEDYQRVLVERGTQDSDSLDDDELSDEETYF